MFVGGGFWPAKKCDLHPPPPSRDSRVAVISLPPPKNTALDARLDPPLEYGAEKENEMV